jgi:BirA family transcriptional regulator, biotin operon repressor / biotin---[acetyl-CoA-carboxylase] ligase
VLADSLAQEVVEPLLTGRFGRPYIQGEHPDRSLPEGATAVIDEPATSIRCSVLLHLPAGTRAEELSLAGAVATAEAVEQALGLAAQIKWPNEVMVDRRKVASILVDAGVLGIELNVNQIRSELPDRTASLLTIDGRRRERAPLLADLLLRLEQAYDAWREGGLDALYADLGARDFLRGRRVSIDGETGIAVAIDRTGRLVIDVGGERRVVERGAVTHER